MRRFAILIYTFALLGCQSAQEPSFTPTPANTPGGVSASPSGSSPPKLDKDTVRLKKATIKAKQGQRWELEAEDIDWMDDRSRALAREVDWWLIDEDGKRWVKVESPEADVNMDTEVVTFTGETLAKRLDFDETLLVQHLVYKGKERMFYGSRGVEWQRGTVKLTGETLTATSQLDKVRLKGKVRGRSKGGFKGLKEPRKVDSSRENRG